MYVLLKQYYFPVLHVHAAETVMFLCIKCILLKQYNLSVCCVHAGTDSFYNVEAEIVHLTQFADIIDDVYFPATVGPQGVRLKARQES